MQARFSLFSLLLFCSFAPIGWAQVQPGTPNFVPQDCHEVDCVSLLSNNVILNVPIRSKSGLFAMSAGLSLNSYMGTTPFHSTSIWYPEMILALGYKINGMLGSFSATGYLNSAAATCPVGGAATTKYWNFYFVSADGAQHVLPSTNVTYASPCNSNSPLTGATTDISGYVLTINNAAVSTVKTSGGITVNSSITSGSLTDSNGNSLSTSGSSPYTVTDTMGVTALTYTPWHFPTTTNATFAWNDVRGVSQTVTDNLSQMSVETNFGCSNTLDFTPAASEWLPSGVTLADGRSIGITYEATPSYSGNVTGRVNQITLPETGTITYSYLGSNNGINCTYQTVPKVQRVLGNGDTTTYTLGYTNTGGSNYNVTNTVVDPGGNQTIYTFSGLSATGNQAYPVAQVVTAIQKYQGTSTLLTTDLYSYNTAFTTTPSASTISTATHSYPITKLIVYHLISGMTTWSASETDFDGYGNVTYSAQYDFGGATPVRATTVTYGSCTASCTTTSPTISNSSMAANGIYNKAGKIVAQQNGTTISQVNITYDAHGNLLNRQMWTGSAFIGQTTANTYNTNGTIAKAYDLANNETDYAYASGNYSDNCSTIFPFPTAVTNVGTGLSISSTYDCEGGVKLTDVDANGNTTVYQYETHIAGCCVFIGDPYWRVVGVADPYGNIVKKNYPTSGFANTSSSSFQVTTTSIEATTRTTDGYGRPINSQTDQSPTGTNFDTLSTSYAWAAGGNREVVTSQPCSVGSGVLCTGNHTYEYDPLGRLYTASTTSNETITHTYSQNDDLAVLTPAPTGENAKQAQTEYDGLGRITKICHIGTTSSTGSGSTCGQNTGSASGATDAYIYSQGTGYSEVYVTRAGTQQRTSYFDAAGRLYQRVTPEGGTWNYYYDTAACTGATASPGNLTCTKDPNGNVLLYFYDALNRLKEVNANGTTCRFFVYDTNYGTVPSGVTTPTNTLGRLAEDYTTACSGSDITDEWHSYNADGQETDFYESTPHSTQYYHSTAVFAANGRVTSLQLANPSLYTMAYGLDGEGRWDTLTDTTASQDIVTGPTTDGGMYDAAGHVLNVQLTGTTPDQDIYTYGVNTGRLLSFEFEVGNTPANLKLTGTLTWNGNGTLGKLAVTDGFNSGGSETCYSNSSSWLGYGYDDWARLLAFDCGSGNVAEYTTYDVYDNVTESVPAGRTGWTFPGSYSSKNQVVGSTYDANGNTTADGGANVYGYNEFSKMKWTASSGTPTCGTSGYCVTYDAFGRAVETSNGTTWTEIWYPQVPGSKVAMNGTTVSYAYWPSPGRGAVLVGGTNTFSFLHQDWLGNDRVVSTITGHSVSADRAYTPYGQQYNTFGSADPTFGIFAGDTGNFDSGVLWDTPNRELAINQIRFTSPDPAGAGWNQYAYPTNPNNFVDPSGLQLAGPGGCNMIDGCGGGVIDPSLGGDGTSCSINQVAADCGSVGALLNIGAASPCPNNVCSGFNGIGQYMQYTCFATGCNYYANWGPGSMFWSVSADGLAAVQYLEGVAGPNATHEYADNLYLDSNGVYSYSPAQEGPECPATSTCLWQADFSNIPDGTDLVGSAHTHTDGFGSGEFSGESGNLGDISTYMTFNPPLYGFVGTSGNRVLMFNPNIYQLWNNGAPGVYPANLPDYVCVLANAYGSGDHASCP